MEVRVSVTVIFAPGTGDALTGSVTVPLMAQPPELLGKRPPRGKAKCEDKDNLAERTNHFKNSLRDYEEGARSGTFEGG